MFFDFEKLKVYQIALDFVRTLESSVTVTVTGSGSGLNSLLSGSVSANAPRPAPHRIQRPLQVALSCDEINGRTDIPRARGIGEPRERMT